jgi:hypothetical protein
VKPCMHASRTYEVLTGQKDERRNLRCTVDDQRQYRKLQKQGAGAHMSCDLGHAILYLAVNEFLSACTTGTTT